ncbi:MAG: UDP-N-acetylmuramate dehydrogenase [Patescibacteria group bacterium]|nr:UDP-N-acetylmuramate dehydrogenase [Patescibacteria group bacterium]
MIEELRSKISPEVRENEPLAQHTTYRIGGPAKYFFVAKSGDEAASAVRAAGESGVEYYILGGGSNVLISDEGYPGLIIKMANRGITIEGTKVKVEAGTPSAFVALQTAEAGLKGFEWAIALPGTLGGAVRGNASMWDGGTAEVVETVRAVKNGETKDFTREECAFGYRESVFKKEGGWVILSVVLSLEQAEDADALRDSLKEMLRKKKDNQPIEYPTAGSIFRNWKPGASEDLEELRKDLDLNKEEEIPISLNGTIPAGWIIDRAQLKGLKVGKVSISEKHANFFINDGDAIANDVIALIGSVKSKVRDMTHSVVQLTEEIEYVGF